MTAAPVSTPAPPKPVIPAAACVALAMGAIALTLIVLLSTFIPLIRLTLAPTPPAVEPLSSSAVTTREREFGTRLASAADKVVRRSPFHPPIIPEPPAPIVPTSYGGPRIVGVAGGAVYFDDNKKIPLGQTIDGIEVISLNAPWSVKLGWKGGTYDVVMLERNPVSFSDSPMLKDTLFKTTPAPGPPQPEPNPSAPSPNPPTPTANPPAPAGGPVESASPVAVPPTLPPPTGN